MTSIGVFTYSTKPRGSVVHATHLAEAVVAAGHDATVYALGKAGARFWRPLACNVDVFPAEEAPVDSGALVRQRIDEFVRGLERRPLRHDVLHAQDCLAASALLAVRARRPDLAPAGRIVRTVHHVEDFESPYLAECQRRSIVEADAVFSVSRMTQREVLEQFGCASALVHNGVDEGRFRDRPAAAREWLEARFGVVAGDAVVLTVGAIEPRKNALGALEAFVRAQAVCGGLRWIVAGAEGMWDQSAYVAAFEARLSELPRAVQARVSLAGPLPEAELTLLYQASDLLLCTAEREGFGLSVLEAMAAGAAVVAPDREPFTEYLSDACALLVDTRAPDAVSAAIVRLVREPALRADLARTGQRTAANFSWERTAATHLALYRSLRLSADEPTIHSYESQADA